MARELYEKQTWENLPPYFVTSSQDKTGKQEILDYIENINNEIGNDNK